MERLDISREIPDGEILAIIDEAICEQAKSQVLSLESRRKLRMEVFYSLRRLDILQELIDDEEITEIMVNGRGKIFYEKHGRILQWDKCFQSREKLEDVIQQIVGTNNRVVNEYSPIVDARLADGSRVNIVLEPIAIDGSCISIRKFPKEPITMEKMIGFGSVSRELVEFLQRLVTARYNIFISGGTGSGKTTFLNALSSFIPADERIVTIEDSAELQIRNIPNLVRLETRNDNMETGNGITIRDLIKTALRMRPDRIIVGEIRGAEALDMLQAMNTGHDGSLSTGHANSCRDMLKRIETMVLMGMELPLTAVQAQIAAGIDILVHLGRMRDRSRKVLDVMEITGYEDHEICLNPLYRFRETGKGREGDRMLGAGGRACKQGKAAAGRNTKEMKDYRKYRVTGKDIAICLVQAAGLSAAVGWLFYRSIWGIFSVIIVLPFVLVSYRRRAVKKQQLMLREQFKECIRVVTASLYSGYSVENAFREAEKELVHLLGERADMCQELRVINQQIRLNMPEESLLRDLAERSGVEEISGFGQVFGYAKRNGSDFVRILKDTTLRISEKAGLEQELQIMVASRQLEQKIMNVIPLGILFFVQLSSPGFLDIMYAGALGRTIMSICLVVYGVAYLISGRIVDIRI